MSNVARRLVCKDCGTVENTVNADEPLRVPHGDCTECGYNVYEIEVVVKGR